GAKTAIPPQRRVSTEPIRLSRATIDAPVVRSFPMPAPTPRKMPPYVVRHSSIHGRGVFARRTLRKGSRIIEYRGDRISVDAAERRPDSDPSNPYHTFLFELHDGRVIDAAV